MKELIKRFLPSRAFIFLRDMVYPEKIHILERRLNNLFLGHYRSLASKDMGQKMAFKNSEFKIYSKHGGDGILAYIFSEVGVTNRVFVEIGVEDGTECNTANLAINFGWEGLLVDADEKWIESARSFYKNYGARPVTCFVNAENINQLVLDNGVQGETDLLSIDIDGNDYWVWQSIDVIKPRVVVLEYNAAFGHRSITQSYEPQHNYNLDKGHPLYFGASLKALTKLSKKKGYILVACDTHGHDAFFVREDVNQGKFKEMDPEKIFYPNPFNLKKFGTIEEQFEQIKNLSYEQV